MANEVRTFTLNDDPGQVIEDLNAAFDGTTQTGLKAGDVKDSINGVALSEIFESDNKTVKKATNATLAEAAKGDTRFQVSGGFLGSMSLDGGYYYFQATTAYLPSGKDLIIKRVRYYLEDSDLRLIVRIPANHLWISSSNMEDTEINHIFSLSPGSRTIQIGIRNIGSTVSLNNANGWWIEFGIE